jgi:hypothetical protein
VSQKSRSDAFLECYRRAVEARRIAEATNCPFQRADFFDIEERWLTLARMAAADNLIGHTISEKIPRPSEESPTGKKISYHGRGLLRRVSAPTAP